MNVKIPILKTDTGGMYSANQCEGKPLVVESIIVYTNMYNVRQRMYRRDKISEIQIIRRCRLLNHHSVIEF